MKTPTIGVIGAGRIGKLHTQNILRYFPGIKVKLIADPCVDEEWAKSQGIACSRDPENIFADRGIQAVLICSPAPLHVPQIITAARAGKHIFCEKPIATDIVQINSALAEVKKAGVKLQVGFNRRFDANFARIKQLIDNGNIGWPHILRITSRDPEIPPAEYLKDSSGMFLDMSIHDFDMARYLSGSEITEIYATGAVLIDPVFKKYNDIDTAVISLKFANGMLGVIDNSRQAIYGYDQRVEVFGSAGAVQAGNNTPSNTTLSNADGIHREKPLRFFLERYSESYIAELQAFFDCITLDTEPAVSGMDGLLATAAGLAAQQSLREGRPVAMDAFRQEALA